MRHLTIPQLCAHLDAELSGPSKELVSRHLAACGECRESLGRLEAQDALLLRVIACDSDEGLFEVLLDEIAEHVAGEKPQLKGKSRRAPWSPPKPRRVPRPTAMTPLASGAATAAVTPRAVEAPPRETEPLLASPPETKSLLAPPRETEPLPPLPMPEPPPVLREADIERLEDPPAPAPATPGPAANGSLAALAAPPASGESWFYIAGGAASLVVVIVLAFLPDLPGSLGLRWHPRAPDRRLPAAQVALAPAPAVEPPGPTSSSKTPPADTAPAIQSAEPPVSPTASPPSSVPPRAKAVATAAPPLPRPTTTWRSSAIGLLCGEVLSGDGNAVAGAQVMMTDVGVVVITDRQGHFCLTAPVGDRTLTVLAVGFTPLHQPVSVRKATAELSLTLETAAPFPTPP